MASKNDDNELPNGQAPRKRNCMSSTDRFAMADSSALIVPRIMFDFFSCRRTMRDSTESSMTRRVMVQDRV